MDGSGNGGVFNKSPGGDAPFFLFGRSRSQGSLPNLHVVCLRLTQIGNTTDHQVGEFLISSGPGPVPNVAFVCPYFGFRWKYNRGIFEKIGGICILNPLGPHK